MRTQIGSPEFGNETTARWFPALLHIPLLTQVTNELFQSTPLALSRFPPSSWNSKMPNLQRARQGQEKWQQRVASGLQEWDILNCSELQWWCIIRRWFYTELKKKWQQSWGRGIKCHWKQLNEPKCLAFWCCVSVSNLSDCNNRDNFTNNRGLWIHSSTRW